MLKHTLQSLSVRSVKRLRTKQITLVEKNSNRHIPARGPLDTIPLKNGAKKKENAPGHNFQLFTANLRLFSTHVNTPAEKSRGMSRQEAFFSSSSSSSFFFFFFSSSCRELVYLQDTESLGP